MQQEQVGTISKQLPLVPIQTSTQHDSGGSSPNSYLEDTESVYSLQDRETDVARDTSDTSTKSECSYNSPLELEYDVNSLSPEDEVVAEVIGSSSDSELLMTHAISSILTAPEEHWITDHESSDNTFDVTITASLIAYNICVQCKKENNNKKYRYCHSCFQVRKSMFPPRPKPRKRKKIETKTKNQASTSSDALSKDSGVDSGQNLKSADLEDTIVPGTIEIERQPSTSKAQDPQPSTSKTQDPQPSSSKTQDPQPSTSKTQDLQPSTSSAVLEPQPSTSSGIHHHIPPKKEKEDPEAKRKRIEQEGILCIMCYTFPRNTIFLHGNTGHMICCYKCAIMSWRIQKCCPVCNCKISNVIKVF